MIIPQREVDSLFLDESTKLDHPDLPARQARLAQINSPKVVAFLRQAGIDVRDVKEEQWFVTGDGVGWVVMQVIEVGW